MRWTKPDKGEKRRMKMRFFESFKQADQVQKLHGKPLIKRYGLLSLPIDTIKEILATLLCIAIMDLTGIGLLAMISKPIRDMVFEYIVRLFFRG